MSGRLDDGAARASSSRPARELDGERRPADCARAPRQRRRTIRCRPRSTSTPSSRSSTTCSTTSTARRWRTRSRCACRSSTTTSSSSAPRSRPAQGAAPDTKYVLKDAARGLSRPDHRQAEDRVLPRGRRPLVPRADARRDHRLPARPEPAVRRVPRPRRGRAARHAPRRRDRREQRPRSCSSILMLEVWLVDVPAARAAPSAPAREPSSAVSEPLATRSSRRRATRPRTCAARRVPRSADGSRRGRWVIVDNGSTDGTLELARAARAPSTPWIDVALGPEDGRRDRGAPDRPRLRGRRRRARPSRRRRREARRRRLVRARLLRAPARAFDADPRSGSRAAARSSSRTASGSSAT